MLGSVADYERALLNLDRLVGRFMGALEERGLLDHALVVVTSDHGWRLDPVPARREAGRLHVPLLVKLPGQQLPLTVDEPIENIRWIGFAELVLAGHTADSTLAAVAARAR
jgi:arylsulfatase A-like enzyme